MPRVMVVANGYGAQGAVVLAPDEPAADVLRRFLLWQLRAEEEQGDCPHVMQYLRGAVEEEVEPMAVPVYDENQYPPRPVEALAVAVEWAVVFEVFRWPSGGLEPESPMLGPGRRAVLFDVGIHEHDWRPVAFFDGSPGYGVTGPLVAVVELMRSEDL